MTNFDIYRLKKAGMSNLVLNQFLDFISSVTSDDRQHPMLLLLPKFIRQATMKHKGLFWERFKQLDIKALRQEFLRFPSFSILDKVYPEYLREIHNPPVLLFYQGEINLLAHEKLGFVGSRDCSSQGMISVRKVIRELGNQFVVISGLARELILPVTLLPSKMGAVRFQ